MNSRQDEFERVALCHSRSLLRVARRIDVRVFPGGGSCAGVSSAGLAQLSSAREGTNARAWLFRILFNCSMRRAETPTVPAMIPLTPRLASVPPSLDEAMEVSRALDGLHIEHRTVLLLGVVEGFTCGEIAGILVFPSEP